MLLLLFFFALASSSPPVTMTSLLLRRDNISCIAIASSYCCCLSIAPDYDLHIWKAQKAGLLVKQQQHVVGLLLLLLIHQWKSCSTTEGSGSIVVVETCPSVCPSVSLKLRFVLLTPPLCRINQKCRATPPVLLSFRCRDFYDLMSRTLRKSDLSPPIGKCLKLWCNNFFGLLAL